MLMMFDPHCVTMQYSPARRAGTNASVIIIGSYHKCTDIIIVDLLWDGYVLKKYKEPYLAQMALTNSGGCT